MADTVLLVEKSEGVATLTLNRPQALNALSRELRRALVDACGALAGDADIGVVILTGAGRAFSAGVDLKELGGESAGATSPAAIVGGGADVAHALRALPQPIIGAINGFAVTGGFELALACDLLVASSEARFADTHARVGIMPGWGLSQRLPRWIGIGRAKQLSFTGNYLSAEQAERWGLVNQVVPPSQLLPTCRALARDMLSCDPATLRGIKRVIDEGYGGTLADGLRLEVEASTAHARSVRPEQIAARRRAIQERGRRQTEA
jgi:enoyl-CoA hydratase